MRLRLIDVVRACRYHGIRMYGYDDVCVLSDSTGAEQPYHVTEMVESRTVFGGPDTWDDEPDIEPGARYKKTNFVQNYTAFGNQDDDDSDGEDSEWSWYGESDADSGSGEEDGDFDMDTGGKKSKPRPWQLPQGGGNQFIDSLEAAQVLVDEQLLRTDPNDQEMDEDSAQGQGYYSDYDGVHEPESAARSDTDARKEDEIWNISNSIHKVGEGDAQRVLHTMLVNDDADQFIIPRQVFVRFFRNLLGNSLNISSVALSALHNVSEQCLHRALTEGVLSYQLRSIIMEERTSLGNELQEQLQHEREKVNERERIISDLKAAFKAKELEMQQQIAELRHQVQQGSNDDVHMRTPTRTPSKRKSPGKRKATTNSKQVDVVRKETVKSSMGSKTLVGSLRSKIQDYALRSKKVRVNPV